MPSVHTLKGIVSSVSSQAGTILNMLREEWARKDIISVVQELSKVPLRSQEIGRTISVIDTQLQDWNRMRFTGQDKILRQGYSIISEPGQKQYSTVIESDVLNLKTGKKETRYTQIYHDDPATKGSLEQEAKTILEETGGSPWLEVEKQRPVQGFVFRG